MYHISEKMSFDGHGDFLHGHAMRDWATFINNFSSAENDHEFAGLTVSILLAWRIAEQALSGASSSRVFGSVVEPRHDDPTLKSTICNFFFNYGAGWEYLGQSPYMTSVLNLTLRYRASC